MNTATNLPPTPSPLRHDTDAILPAAAYLRYESRADGWSAGRQAAFLAHLADHGVVADAARTVGKSLSGGYALRRTARGYAFNLGWEAALLIARRVVFDRLMTAAIKGEESRWVREEGVTTFVRQNTKLSLTLLDRINPATALPEVMAVATRFDWYLQLIDDGVCAQELWSLFFDDALPRSDMEARDRVRAALLLTEETANFEGAGDDRDADDADDIDNAPMEYKSMVGTRQRRNRNQRISPHQFDLAQCNLLAIRRLSFCGPDMGHHQRTKAIMSHTPHDLHAEFPDATEALHTLKTTNDRFVKMTDQYHELNREIHRIDSGIEPASDDRTEELKKQRLSILDQVSVMINEVST